jgi:hypothetical protein
MADISKLNKVKNDGTFKNADIFIINKLISIDFFDNKFIFLLKIKANVPIIAPPKNKDLLNNSNISLLPVQNKEWVKANFFMNSWLIGMNIVEYINKVNL